jgi:rod shape-determining protein MreD
VEKTLMNRVRLTIFLVIVFFLHLLFYQYLSAGEIYPDLFLVLVIYCSLNWGPTLGAFSGFLTGIVQDSFSFTYFGLHALAKIILGFVIGSTRQSFFSNSYLVQAGIIFTAKLLHDIIFYGIYMFRGPGSFWHQIFFHTVPAALYTSFLGVALYFIFNIKTKTKRW